MVKDYNQEALANDLKAIKLTTADGEVSPEAVAQLVNMRVTANLDAITLNFAQTFASKDEVNAAV